MVNPDLLIKPTAKTIRQSLGIYSDPDAPLFKSQGFILTALQFLLRSSCLSLEIFIHLNFGKRYVTVPKLLAAIILPTCCLFLSQFDFNFKVGLSLTQPGFLEVVRPNAERIADAVANEVSALQAEVNIKAQKHIASLKEHAAKIASEAKEKISAAEARMKDSPLVDRALHTDTVTTLKHEYESRIASLQSDADDAQVALEKRQAEAAELASETPAPSILDRSGQFFRNLINPITRPSLLIGLSLFFVIFSVFANLQLVWIYISRIFQGLFGVREAHPHSSGEPLVIFDPLYILAHKLNAKTDLIKQFAEPAACYMLGMALKQWKWLPVHFEFISAWLMLGGFLIFVRVYMENRNREKIHLDRLANERNAEAFHLQESLTQPRVLEAEVQTARGR